MSSDPDISPHIGGYGVGTLGPTGSTQFGTAGVPGPVEDITESGEGVPVVSAVKRTVSNSNFMTSRLEKMGWMDTYSVHPSVTDNDSEQLTGDATHDTKAYNDMWAQRSLNMPCMIPKIFMGVIMLPPAYKTEQYFRLVINHNLSFAGFRGASMDTLTSESVGNAPSVFNFN